MWINIFLSLPFISCFRFTVSNFCSKSVCKQEKRTFFCLQVSHCLHYAVLCCAVAACSVVPVNLAYGFSFPFYLNKLSYLKSPPVQAHASGAATAAAAFFLLSFVLFFCHSNRNELWTRVRVFVFIYRDASSARLSILMSIIWTIYK